MNKRQLEKELKVGTIIKIGNDASELCGLPAGKIITLIEETFEKYNGLFDETENAPSIYDEEFLSIYHLFGNDLEDFFDSEIIGQMAEDFTICDLNSYENSEGVI